jgi:hypothetical protein
MWVMATLQILAYLGSYMMLPETGRVLCLLF